MANRVLYFDRKTGGTGGSLDHTYLGKDVSPDNIGGNRVVANWSMTAEGPWSKIQIDTFYFASPVADADYNTARKDAAAYLEVIRSACHYRPPILKELARGAAVLVHSAENFGSIVNEGDGSTLLADCQLLEASITDDVGIHGVGVRFVFGAIAACAVP